MPYATNLPRRARPRGLGDLAGELAGLGTWQVDMPWGLSPAVIPGQPRPYGPNIVTTMFPRTDHPRVTGTDRFVIPGGTWPRQLPAYGPGAGSVFRTPVVEPGAMAIDLPGHVSLSGFAGVGWVDVGIAHPPTYLYEKQFRQFRGYGAGQDLPGSLTAFGSTITLTDEDKQWLKDHPTVLEKMFWDLVRWNAALKSQFRMYDALMRTSAFDNMSFESRQALADTTVFESAENRLKAARDFETLNRIRGEIASKISPSDLVGVPDRIKRAYIGFTQQFDVDVSGARYGMEPTTVFLIILGVLAAVGLGAIGIKAYEWISPSADRAAAAAAEAALAEARTRAKVTELQGAQLSALQQRYNDPSMPASERAVILGMMKDLTDRIGGAVAAGNKDKDDAGAGGGWTTFALFGLATAGLLYAMFRTARPSKKEDEKAPAKPAGQFQSMGGGAGWGERARQQISDIGKQAGALFLGPGKP